jgi:hypothetical protein
LACFKGWTAAKFFLTYMWLDTGDEVLLWSPACNVSALSALLTTELPETLDQNYILSVEMYVK